MRRPGEASAGALGRPGGRMCDGDRCDIAHGAIESVGHPFTPEAAMLLTNARWKTRNTISTGSVMSEV